MMERKLKMARHIKEVILTKVDVMQHMVMINMIHLQKDIHQMKI